MNIFKIIPCGLIMYLMTCQAKHELSSELQELLNAITPAYQENLKRAFQNEGVRRQNMDRTKVNSHLLDDVLFTLNDNIIELKNLKLVQRPDFRVNRLAVDFNNLGLNVSLNLGTLRIEGDYIANNKTLQHLLPITHSGKIEFQLKSVYASGKVGFYIREDSFVIENYDLEYEATEGVAINVTYFKGDSRSAVLNETSEDQIEGTLADKFWPQLKDTLTFLFHLQLGAVIVEDSVTELLADNDEELREYSRQQAIRANRFFDSLLYLAKNEIVANGGRLLQIPPLNVVYQGRQPGHSQGWLEATRGSLQDLSTLTRSKDMSLYEDKEKVVIYGNINLREFKFCYEKYSSEHLKTLVEGNIRAIIYQNKVFLKVSVSKTQEQCLAQLETIQVRTVKDIDVDVSGLGSLSWLAGQVESWIVGMLRNQGLLILEERISRAFEQAIKTTDCTPLLND